MCVKMGNSSSNQQTPVCTPNHFKVIHHRKPHPIFGTLSLSVDSFDPGDRKQFRNPQMDPIDCDEELEMVLAAVDDSVAIDCDPESRLYQYSERYRRIADDNHTTSSFEMIDPEVHLKNTQQQQQQFHRPHSVLGFSDSDPGCNLITCCDMSEDPNGFYAQQPTQQPQQYPLKRKPNGIRLPPVPLPRSKSFHQILRSTHNGQILASKGTIRGASEQQPKRNQRPPIGPSLVSNDTNDFLSKKVSQQRYDSK